MTPTFNIEYKGAGGRWMTSLTKAIEEGDFLGIKELDNGDSFHHYPNMQEMNLAGARKLSKQEIYDLSELILRNENNRYVKSYIKDRLQKLRDERLENSPRKIKKIFWCFFCTPNPQSDPSTKNNQLLKDFLDLKHDGEKMHEISKSFDGIKRLNSLIKNTQDPQHKLVVEKDLKNARLNYKQSEIDIAQILLDLTENEDVLDQISVSELLTILKPLFSYFSNLERSFGSFYKGKAVAKRLEKANFEHLEEAEKLKNSFNEQEVLELLKRDNDLILLLDQSINLVGQLEIFKEIYTATEERMQEIVQHMPYEIFSKAIQSDDFRPETIGEKTGSYAAASSIFKDVQKRKNIQIANVI